MAFLRGPQTSSTLQCGALTLLLLMATVETGKRSTQRCTEVYKTMALGKIVECSVENGVLWISAMMSIALLAGDDIVKHTVHYHKYMV